MKTVNFCIYGNKNLTSKWPGAQAMWTQARLSGSRPEATLLSPVYLQHTSIPWLSKCQFQKQLGKRLDAVCVGLKAVLMCQKKQVQMHYLWGGNRARNPVPLLPR